MVLFVFIVKLRSHPHTPCSLAIGKFEDVIAVLVCDRCSSQDIVVVEEVRLQLHSLHRVFLLVRVELPHQIETVLHWMSEVESAVPVSLFHVIRSPSLDEHQDVCVRTVLGIIALKIVERIVDVALEVASQQHPGGDVLRCAVGLCVCVPYRQGE